MVHVIWTVRCLNMHVGVNCGVFNVTVWCSWLQEMLIAIDQEALDQRITFYCLMYTTRLHCLVISIHEQRHV